ncbi:hypothetical protein AAW14_23135 [Streptomyces hygroscopicus]|uniref:hypothetical protein n=1 Tax=Streptomyces hygroscopicus TaxID=1912 RepID=UPI00223EFBA6|nr:hypothetical protein [Streptomyces hygroscopicus]MCW7944826.1 hypothetical protein [Streptomyces hygroscopicus]
MAAALEAPGCKNRAHVLAFLMRLQQTRLRATVMKVHQEFGRGLGGQRAERGGGVDRISRLHLAHPVTRPGDEGVDELNLAGEALHTTVHGGVKLWVVVVTAVRARARAGSAWQACRGSALFVATQQRRRTTHG